MANEEHLDLIVRTNSETWNSWRRHNPEVKLDFSGAQMAGTIQDEKDLAGADFSGADLSYSELRNINLHSADLTGANLRQVQLGGYRTNLTWAKLRGADLTQANLIYATLINADLTETNLYQADLTGANLMDATCTGANFQQTNLLQARLWAVNFERADLRGANLSETDLNRANLTNANLVGGDLTYSRLVNTNLEGAQLTNCRIYGTSAWDLKVSEETDQSNLIVSRSEEAPITVDDVEVAQFVYLLLNNEKLRNVIDTMTSKAVLILGRFTPERKTILEAVRQKLRELGYLPILFDFARPSGRDLTEAVSTLARLARFIVADITDPSSIPKELEAVVPDVAIPVTPLIEESVQPYAMFRDYWKYHWVLEAHRYEDLENLLVSFEDEVVAPAEAKFIELERARVQALGR